MDKLISVYNAPDQNAGALKTKFVTKEQTAILRQILDLAFEDMDQVAGGDLPDTIICINCCKHHNPATGRPLGR
jgi:hypothetical protein